MAKPKFTIDDGEAVSSGNPTVRRAIEFLESLPGGRLLTLVKLAESLSRSPDRMQEIVRFSILKEYRALDRNRYLYGNRKTVKAFNEQKG